MSFVQDLVKGRVTGQEVIQLCDIQARQALMIYSSQGAVNGGEINQDLEHGQRTILTVDQEEH